MTAADSFVNFVEEIVDFAGVNALEVCNDGVHPARAEIKANELPRLLEVDAGLPQRFYFDSSFITSFDSRGEAGDGVCMGVGFSADLPDLGPFELGEKSPGVSKVGRHPVIPSLVVSVELARH
ncbi:hypothetical protein AAC387_Pa04g1319 [Persea americana]